MKSNRKERRIEATALVATLVGGLLALVATATPAFADDPACPAAVVVGTTATVTCSYTGGAQTWTAPGGVTQASFDVRGAQGGSADHRPASSALGGAAHATLTFAPNQTFAVTVGGAGGRSSGGFGGGGAGGQTCDIEFGCTRAGGGGGRSEVADGTGAVIVAGGGGGDGTSFGGGVSGDGGTGGGTNGGPGTGGAASPGAGGDQTGTAGSHVRNLGGAGGSPGSGGGGGGFYGGEGGGGGGGTAGGGGGSGHTPDGTGMTNGVQAGNGVVTITYTLPTTPCSPPVITGSVATVTCAFTGGYQTWTAPVGVTQATFDVRGAQGGSASLADGAQVGTSGGLGGEAQATLSFPASQQFSVVVGGAGALVTGGFGGGGGAGPASCSPRGCDNAGGGGGRSEVAGGAALSVVAGGGGGGGVASGCCPGNGGSGGGTTGGTGGTPGGGAGGNQDGSAGSGAHGVGRAGTSFGGGGGGGGFWGGAGGSDLAGGGGGSGFTPDGTGMTNGVQAGDGIVTIAYAVNQAPSVSPAHGAIGVPEGATRTNGGAVHDPDGDTVNLTASIGSVVNNNDGTWTWTYTAGDGPSGPTSVTIYGDDGHGGTTSTSFTISVPNVPPTATLTGSTINEGDKATVSFSGQSDPSAADTTAGFHYAFACDDSSLAGVTYATTHATASKQCAYDDGPSTQVVRARIIDKDGGFTEYETNVVVNNAPPGATFNIGLPVPEGSSFTLSLTDASDQSQADRDAGFTYAFDCGDGLGYSPYSSTASRSCPTTDDDNFTVGGRIMDKDGGVTEYTGSGASTSVPPTATLSNSGPVNEESPVTVSFGPVSDPSPADNADGFHYAFACDDGPLDFKTYAGTGTASSTTCTFDDGPSTHVVKARVIDEDNGYTETTTTVTVNDVAPTAPLSAGSVVSEGSPATISFGTVTEPSTGDRTAGFHYAFACDGGSLASATYASSGISASTTCTYDDGPSNHTVRGRVIDKDGGFTEATTTASVANLAPSATFNAPAAVNTGATFSLSLTGATDASAADRTAGFTYAFNCGSGLSAFGASSTASCTAPLSGTSVSVGGQVKDKDGAVHPYTASINLTTPAKVLFVSTRNGNSEIYSMLPDGSGVTRLTNNAAIDTSPAWSPDHTKVAFSSTRGGFFDVYVMNADGSNVVRLTNDHGVDTSPTWSPDGTKIAFSSTRAGWLPSIWVMKADGTGATRLTKDGAIDMSPAWSPNSATIVFSSSRSGTFDIYSMAATGASVTRLTTSSAVDATPGYTRSGTTILFSTDRDKNLEIYSMTSTGTAVTRITNNPAVDTLPAT